MGDKTASRLGCGPDWEQRESEGAGELPRLGAKIAPVQGLGSCPEWEQRQLAGKGVVPTGSRWRVKGLGSC